MAYLNIKILFDEADQSGDGKISKKELKKLFKKHGTKLTDTDVKKMINRFDKDGSKDFDFQEFRALITDVIAADKKYEEAYEAFKVFDANNDNVVTREEALEGCKYLPVKLTDREFEQFMTDLDVDGNGVINFDEFARAYAVGI